MIVKMYFYDLVNSTVVVCRWAPAIQRGTLPQHPRYLADKYHVTTRITCYEEYKVTPLYLPSCTTSCWAEFCVQACRNGLVQHLEHLLFYGADMNARNASGNTPLHVCAVNSQESCARLLLFRGCERDALNYANQTPYQVAVIAGNLELAEVIQNHRPEDVGELVCYILCMHKHSLPGKYRCVPCALQLIALAPGTHKHTPSPVLFVLCYQVSNWDACVRLSRFFYTLLRPEIHLNFILKTHS